MIGPVTERRLKAAFAKSCLIDAQTTAALLGMDVKTLRETTDAGVIRAVLKGGGKTRAYTEGDIRAYLTESVFPCPSTAPRRARTGITTSSSKVVGFTARRALKRAAQQKS